eukprot:GHVS01036648.1.p1 GENE.GHVS01036648.1~~GHVS01036648.1.p1  ORF type:complete len:363 (+),score=42.79 GHVS01036648.1:49-1089(+)
MVLVFSLQPNDINAATSVNPEFQLFRDFLFTYHQDSEHLSDFSELYWLFSAEGMKNGQIRLKGNAVWDINSAFDKKHPGTSVKATAVSFIGSDTDNDVGNDIVSVTLDDGNKKFDLEISVGPRLMGGPEARKDLLDVLHPLVFSESHVRKQMIKFAYRLCGENFSQGVLTENFNNIGGTKLDFKNRFGIQVVSGAGTLRLLQDGVLSQAHRSLVSITNLNDVNELWTKAIEMVGVPFKVEELSEEQDKLFDDFQKQLLANVESEWGDCVRSLHQEGRIEEVRDVNKVKTVFNPKGTDDKFTVTTELRWACEEGTRLKLVTLSVVSSDEDLGRTFDVSQNLYIDEST